jgi:tripartite-type tricarboxylate transporter receptor subunit TctC
MERRGAVLGAKAMSSKIPRRDWVNREEASVTRIMISRLAVGGGVALLGATLLGGPALAQGYPTDRITFVVGFAAGGFADTVARLIGEHVSEQLGQPVTVENRPGAASNIAARYVASADPDGYTVLVTTTALAVNQTLYEDLDYSFDELEAVAVPVFAPESLSVHPSKPGTLSEFLEWAAEEGMTFGTAGVGSGSHIALDYFFVTHTDVDAVHVPFGGGAPAIQAVVGDQVDALAATLPPVTSHINDRAVTCLALAGPERSSVVPDCPTFAEAGYPGFEAGSWVGFFVPAGTDSEVIEALNTAINSALEDEETRERLVNLGNTPTERSPSEAADFVRVEVDRWGEMVTTLGVTVQ